MIRPLLRAFSLFIFFAFCSLNDFTYCNFKHIYILCIGIIFRPCRSFFIQYSYFNSHINLHRKFSSKYAIFWEILYKMVLYKCVFLSIVELMIDFCDNINECVTAQAWLILTCQSICFLGVECHETHTLLFFCPLQKKH